jgi:P-type Cu+ transporter
LAAATGVELDIEGMTCASCAARIERKLNQLPGVEASVNYANERASVQCSPGVGVDQLVGPVEATGYHAHPRTTVRRRPEEAADHHRHDAVAVLRRRLEIAVLLTAPLALVAMAPPLHFSWEWRALALSTPVVFYCGIGFHRATLVNARHGAATMDTLISLGTLAA